MRRDEGLVPTDEQWKAIEECNPAYDGMFYYAVATTGIFCRPSCKSRTPSKENVRIFPDFISALDSKFRPCKRCKPDGRRQPMEEWVEQIVRMIETMYAEPLTLDVMAERVHSSPYHLQRSFKRVKGVAPHEYLQQVRIQAAKKRLLNSGSPVSEIGESVGIQNAAHFATVFRKATGMTPSEYRRQGEVRMNERK